MRLQYKLLLLLLVSAVLPLSVYVLVSYHSINDRLRSEWTAQYNSQVEQLNQSFEMSLQGIDNSILGIYQTAELYNFVTGVRGTDVESIDMQRRVENLLKILAHSLSDFSHVYLYLDDRGQLFSVNAKYLNVQHEWLPSDDSVDWISTAQAGNGDLVIASYVKDFEDISRPVLFVGRSIPDVITKRQSGVIGIDLSEAYFENIVGRNSTLERIDVIGADGSTLYSTMQHPIEESGSLKMESGVNKFGWKVVAYLSNSTLSRITWEAVRLIVVWGVVFLIAAIVLGGMLSRQISAPLYAMVKKMREVGHGKFNVSLWTDLANRRDEFGYMGQQFRSMVMKIDDLIQHEYQLKTNESLARIKALQAQINPHFLYNTLTSIYSEALEAGADNVCRMVKSLSSMFRYTTEYAHDIVPLSAEIEHVRNYLDIQKFRFEDKLDMSINVPANILDKPTVKLSLQPVVENAIEHGISRVGKGLVTITAMEDEGHISVVVEDTAGLMDEQEADGLTRRIQENNTLGASIGLSNVHMRIKHHFAGSRGVAIKAEKGRTTVIISWKVGA